MLDQYSGSNDKLRGLDSALKDAVEMVRVSDQRINYLRKMHALLLLKRVKEALEGCQSDDEATPRRRDVSQERLGGLEGEFSDFSESDDDRDSGAMLGSAHRRERPAYDRRGGPDSDEFLPVPGTGGRHSRGPSFGKGSEFGDDPGLQLLEGYSSDERDEKEDPQEYTAQPYFKSLGYLAPEPNDTESDLEKGDSGSNSSTAPGSSEPKKPQELEGPQRFAKRFQRQRRVNWKGLTVFIIYILAFLGYMFVRITKTLGGLGSYLPYGIFVLLVEIMGASTTIIYGVNLIYEPVHEKPNVISKQPPPGKADIGGDMDSVQLEESTKGSDYGGTVLSEDGYEEIECGHYNIRVLIPCYKEDLKIVMATVEAIKNAALPAGCTRTIYVCDDGNSKHKRRAFMRMPDDVVYVAGRKKPKGGDPNGKSANLNNVCHQLYPEGYPIPANEIICVMDADQRAEPMFFMKLVPLLDGGDDVGMVLSPQCFDNINKGADIFNHQNIHFWEYMQPGYDCLGFISCSGTNFLIRSKAFQECGWSPHYTLTEDFALGMELKKRHWHCRYVKDYLAIGEAPEDVRQCFQQRSRWAKGHFQVIFSEHNPFKQKGLSLGMKILFCSGVWSYIVAFIATPTFILVPLLTIWVGVFPIVLNIWAAGALTVYYLATSAVLQYFKKWAHIRPLWFSNVSTVIMFFTYMKACFNIFVRTYISKKALSFKSTAKTGGVFSRLTNSSLSDLFLPLGILIALIVSFGIGLSRAIAGATVKTTLLVSLVWMLFNMIPFYLLLHYTFIGRGSTLKLMSKILMLASFVLGIMALGFIWWLYPKELDYTGALNKSITFFQSQQVGQATAANGGFGVNWRQAAYVQDAQSPIVAPLTATLGAAHDSSGGWMTGGPGGNIKMVMPTAFSTAMLAWSVLSFEKGFNKAKAKPKTLSQIQTGVEFLKKTLLEYTPGNPDFFIIYQVGNLSTESRYWGYPEAFQGARPSYYVPTMIGTSDLTSSMSAAFVSASIAFQKSNVAYAQSLLNLGADLYKTAKAYPGSYSTRIQSKVCNSQFGRGKIGQTGALLAGSALCKGPYDALNGSALAWYNSTSYYDDMAWAASWLFQATGQQTYLQDAMSYYVLHSQGPEGDTDSQLLFNWDNTFWGANLKLVELRGDPAYHRQMQFFLKYWVCGTGGVPVKFTPLGRSYNSNDGTLGTTANAVFLSTLYGKLTKSKYAAKAKRYTCWARAQTRYMLGDNHNSFVVGFGSGYPTHVQSMGASCPGIPVQGKAQNCTAVQLTTRKGNPHEITGALVEQSAFTDSISTVRASNSSRVAPEYNAAFTGVLAGVAIAPGDWSECLQGNGVLSTDKDVCSAAI